MTTSNSLREPNIGIISEGITDFELLNELICTILNKQRDCKPLQPTNYSSCDGWSGVWDFCKNAVSAIGIDKYCNAVFPNLDLLVVALDGDVTRNGDVYCSLYNYYSNCMYGSNGNPLECHISRSKLSPYTKCCYPTSSLLPNLPIADRRAFLENVILKWLDVPAIPNTLIIVIPFDMIESWIVCAKSGHEINGIQIEEFIDPYKNYLQNQFDYFNWKPSLEGKVSLFRKFKNDVVSNWDIVKKHCYSANLFDIQLKQKFSQTVT